MACILLWMGGGPSQLDTFDPKPGTDTGGETKAIDTAVPGIQIAHHWPTDRQGDEGRRPDPVDDQQGRQPPAGDLPAPHRLRPLGHGQAPRASAASAAAELGDPKFDLPHIVSIGGGRPSARGHPRREVRAVPRRPTRSSPPLNVELPVPAGRFVRRLNLMHSLEVGGLRQLRRDRPGPASTTTSTSRPPSMVLSPHMKAFDVEAEDPKTRAAYGETPFGQGCLLARRLVQAGVTFVEVRSDGWDNHEQRQRQRGQERRRGRPRLRLARRRPEAAGDARPDPGRLDGRVRPDPQDQPQRRPRPLPPRLQRRPGRRRRQGRPGHRLLHPRRHRRQGPPGHRQRPDGQLLPVARRSTPRRKTSAPRAGRSRSSTAARSIKELFA